MDAEIIINGIVGLLGAVIGGGASLLATNIQIKQKNKEDEVKKKNEKELSTSIVNTFLINEIDFNVKDIKWLEEYFDKDFASIKASIGLARTLKFEEFNNVKYKLIETNTILSLKILEIYQMFYMLSDKSSRKKLNEFNENEFNYIVNSYRMANDMVKSHFESKFQYFD